MRSVRCVRPRSTQVCCSRRSWRRPWVGARAAQRPSSCSAPSSRIGCFAPSLASRSPSWPASFSSPRGFQTSCLISSSSAYRSGLSSPFSHGCSGSGDAMKAAGTARRAPPVGRLISLAIVAIAIALGFYALRRSALLPSTDASTIDADFVHIASSVGGRIISIPVAENARVAEGDLLFQIDPVPYQFAVAQAEADLAIAEAALATQRRVLSTQRSAATVAREQTQRTATNLELATRTVERLRPLAAKGYVPTQQLDQAQTTQRDAETSLRQAREQEAAAERAVDTEEGAEATVRARKAALAIARRALEKTTVRASHARRGAGPAVSSREIVAPSQTLLTLVHTG